MFASGLSPRRRLPHTLTALLASLLPFFPAVAQTAVPHAEVAGPTSQRLIIVYRSGFIPADAANRLQLSGARLLRRHEQFGLAIAEGGPEAQARLRSDPNVEFAVADRYVSAQRLTAIRAMPEDEPLQNGKFAGGRTSRLLPSAPKAIVTAPLLPADRFYRDTPQGWAVKAVGGYGGGIAGGPTTGPWATTTGGGVRIAVLDSGVDANHPDLRPNLALNLSEVDQSALPSPCDDGSPQDQQGHGSWVASLAAASAGPGTGDVVGAAPAAVLLNIKVLQRMPGTGATLEERCSNGQASGLLSWVLQGIDDAVAQRAHIISLSLGTVVDVSTGDGAGLKTIFDRATGAATAAGVVVIASAGNDAFDLSDPRYVELPAQARDVLTVVASTNPDCAEDLRPGAVCRAGAVSLPYYSNRGSSLNAVAAPGGSYPAGDGNAVSGWVRGACAAGLIHTADGPPTDQYHSMGCFDLGHQPYLQAIGTSASAPLVAGVAALVRAAHPDWSARTVVDALLATAKRDAGLPYGAVDAEGALLYKP